MKTTPKMPEILTHSAADCEQIAKAIESCAAAAKAVIAGPLTMHAACLLIREALPHGMKGRVTVPDIRAVLESAAGLRVYVKRPSPDTTGGGRK